MAGVTGLEPATSAVTGQRSNQLSYTPSPDTTQMYRCEMSSFFVDFLKCKNIMVCNQLIYELYLVQCI